ncbi:22326_t:CDS:2, partial [Gigaspora rosea]
MILESLLKNNVPLALLAMTMIININSRNVKNCTGCIVDLIEEDDDNGLNYMNNKRQEYKKTIFESFDSNDNLPELRSSDMTYINNNYVLEQDHSLKLLEKMIQETTNYKQSFDTTFSEGPNANSNKDEENKMIIITNLMMTN